MKQITLLFTALFMTILTYGQTSGISVEKIGKGEVVIFLPGFTCPGDIWKDMITDSDKYQYHLISYAGFNGNIPVEMPWYKNVKESLLNYIEENNFDKIQLIGHSVGGNFAVDIAAEYKNIVDKVVLIDALPCMREVMMPGVLAENIQYKNPYNDKLLAMNSDEFRNSIEPLAVNMTNKKEKVKDIISWIVESDRKTYVYGYTDLLKLDLREKLKDIKSEVLIVVAPFPSEAIAKSTIDSQYINLENKRVEIIADTKHFIMFDQAELLSKTINNFISNE